MSDLAYGDIIRGKTRPGDDWTAMLLAPSPKTSLLQTVWDMIVLRDKDDIWGVGLIVDINESTALTLRLTPDQSDT